MALLADFWENVRIVLVGLFLTFTEMNIRERFLNWYHGRPQIEVRFPLSLPNIHNIILIIYNVDLDLVAAVERRQKANFNLSCALSISPSSRFSFSPDADCLQI